MRKKWRLLGEGRGTILREDEPPPLLITSSLFLIFVAHNLLANKLNFCRIAALNSFYSVLVLLFT